MQRCAQLPEAVPRLACYDALAARLRDAPPPTAAAAAAPPTAAQKIEAFGAPLVAQKDQLDAIESSLEGLVDGWEANTVFTLANGQRWKVTDGTRGVMNLRNPRVWVRRGALGSFRIEFEGSKQTAFVKRL